MAVIASRRTSSQAAVERSVVRVILAAFPFDGSAAEASLAAAKWPLLAKAAEGHGLSPLVYAALKQRDRLNEIPASVAKALKLSYLRASVANWLAFQQLAGFLDLFERAQIPVVLLKGCALAATLYADPALRPMGDLDLLIPRSAMPQVRSLLIDQGFEPPVEVADGFLQRFFNAQPLSRSGNRPARVDVHWHLLGVPFLGKRVDMGWFWQRTVEARVEGRAARVFSSEAQLLHLCAHFVYHHGASRLLWSYDLALLVARHGGQMNWEEVFEAAARFGLALSLKQGLVHACDWWGVTLPPAVAARLDATRPSLAGRVLHRLVIAADSELGALAFVVGMPGLRAKLELVLRQVFPTIAYMRRRYGAGRDWLLPFYYLRRAAKGFGRPVRFAISLLGLRLEA